MPEFSLELVDKAMEAYLKAEPVEGGDVYFVCTGRQLNDITETNDYEVDELYELSDVKGELGIRKL